VFSASLIGILFGSALFGFVGDRYGRKAALVWANLVFGVFTLGAAYSTNLDQMFWLRLLAGLGIGGVIPNVVAINAESAPRKLRATLAIIAVGCVPLIPTDLAVAASGARAAQNFEKRRFEARVPVSAVDAPSAGIALNNAATHWRRILEWASATKEKCDSM
jgi:MFS family permease